MSDELANEWIDKAEEDYRTVEELYSKSPAGFANTICFHAQQCPEKYPKALLTKHEIEPPPIHTLETLLDLIITELPELEEFRAILAELTAYATEYRYLGKVASQAEASACREIIRGLRSNMRQRFNLGKDTNCC